MQQIIQEDDLLPNVRAMGAYLGQCLHERLGSHPHVGDIRGRGLFWAVSFLLGWLLFLANMIIDGICPG